MDLKRFGPYVFLVGFAIAVLVAVAGQSLGQEVRLMLLGALGVLGLIVGLVNVSEKEAVPFLIAVIALLQVQTALNILKDLPMMATVVPWFNVIIAALVAFVLPAALVVALKAIYDLAGENAFETVELNVISNNKKASKGKRKK